MMTEGSYDWEEEDIQKKDSLNLNSIDCWDYTIELECLAGSQDLQLAAELAKNLLARNKELENCVKQCQTTIEEQTQEIEYLSKQMTALRKTNDDRIRIYEQLEVSIQDLERANQRLALDSSTDKKQIKSLCAYRDSLEERCEELQKALDEARSQQKEKKPSSQEGGERGVDSVEPSQTEDGPEKNDLVRQNHELKRQITDLEEKILKDMAMTEAEHCRLVQDMASMREELSTRYQEQFKHLQEEITEVRSGSLCGRCMEAKRLQMIMAVEEDEEEVSNGIPMETKENNPYRTLVEKYEASLEEQSRNRRRSQRLSSINFLSLQDELKPYWDRNDSNRNTGKRKVSSNTPTDFSEAETFSSGFSDETSNKATQTDRNLTPGSFLCTIADGEDCVLNIYDDGCPIESRTREKKLPLLDDVTPIGDVPKVPPVTPAREDAPGFDDVQSLPDSVATEEEKPAESSNVIESITVGLKVKNRRSNNSPGRRKGGDRVEEGEGTPRNSPRRSGRRKKDRKNYDSPRTQSPAMKPRVLTTLQRTNPGSSHGKGQSSWEFKPFMSTAALEIAKLKHLEKSYAEVLRSPPPPRSFHGYSLTKCMK
ncbi:UNVERIFIED_CONTAM: hypothetical protein PYX00_005413 [Menopon gallinae]|uniref:Cerebellar degeneration-related protein 2-like n=1 Tax=Menopon gallinae TaxID=328185 RepID=A0AAW2HRC6_9NEOP